MNNPIEDINFDSIDEISEAIAILEDTREMAEQYEADQAEFNDMAERESLEREALESIRLEQEAECEAAYTESQNEAIIRLCGEVITNRLESPGKLTGKQMNNLAIINSIRMTTIEMDGKWNQQ